MNEPLVNSRTGAIYAPNTGEVANFIKDGVPRYRLLKGGEGGGTSSAAIVKTISKLAAGLSGIMVAPSLMQLQKDLWPTFRSWCPPTMVLGKHRYRLNEDWIPGGGFTIDFESNELGQYCRLIVGGVGDPDQWHGPNSHFVYMDAIHRIPNIKALKVLDGGCRLTANNGMPPEIFCTGLPQRYHRIGGEIQEHWMYNFFTKNSRAQVYTARSKDNASLGKDWVKSRAATLSSDQQHFYIDGEWPEKIVEI